MNTNQSTGDENKLKGVNKPKKEDIQPKVDFFFAGSTSDPVSNVVNALNAVDSNASDAEQNKHSISDNNGGRIELNEDGKLIVKK